MAPPISVCTLGAFALIVVVQHATATSKLRRHGGMAPLNATSRQQRKDIIAIYMNMADRPARRDFAEEQYRTLGLPAIRIEGTSVPDKNIGPEHTWLRALESCTNRSEKFCLISEDDAVFRPLYERPEDAIDTAGFSSASRITAADPVHFFSELDSTLAAMPGGVDGEWHGLHLCAKGQESALKFIGHNVRAQGNPWPKEMFSDHILMPGAPDVLLLRRNDAKLYASKFRLLLEKLESTHVSKPIDAFQAMLYASQAPTRGMVPSKGETPLNMFVAARPQLCQHLADLTDDANYRTSRSEFSAPG